jgi:hypothetical protein
MGAVASFDYATWSARYPNFSNVAQPTVAALWNEATLYLDNSGNSPVQDAGQQQSLLGMLTAHLAQLNFGDASNPASPIVGRISSATQGSVSVSADLPNVVGSAAWFAQTKYGLAYWQAMAPYRTARYIPGPRKSFEPPYGLPGLLSGQRRW